MLTVHMVGQGHLVAKMSKGLEIQMHTEIEAETKLRILEQNLQKTPSNFLEAKIAFIPDHLGFGCSDGVAVYEMDVPPLKSYVVIREP